MGEYLVNNGGSTPLTGWTLEFDLSTGADVTSAWNAQLTAAGPHVALKGEAWTDNLAPGDRITAGFQVAAAATATVVPANCQLNGRPCVAAPTTSTTAPVTTAPATTAPATTVPPTTAPPITVPAPAGVSASFARTSDWGSGYIGEYTIRNGSSGGVPPTTVPPVTTTVPPATTTTTSSSPTTMVPAGGGSGATAPGFVPYVDMTLTSDSLAAMSAASGVRRLSLGFVVSGAPCQASWGGYYGLDDPTIRPASTAWSRPEAVPSCPSAGPPTRSWPARARRCPPWPPSTRPSSTLRPA